MAAKILQINFRFNNPRSDFEAAAATLAEPVAAVPGCRWKIWLMNEASRESGGIYLFDDDASLQAYLAGPIVAGITSHPALSNFSVKQFDLMPKETAITRGPVGVSAHALA
jgi:putative monooxygenase ydhR